MRTDALFATLEQAPAVQSLRQRVEQGGVLTCAAVHVGAHPFLAVLLEQLFPQRPVVIVTPGVKTQECFQQDVETWLQVKAQDSKVQSLPLGLTSPTAAFRSLFYPAWEILAQDAKLPHVDVISERLETLIALSGQFDPGRSPSSLTIVTTVVALLQRTFSAEALRQRTRRVTRGEIMDPQRLVEWLQDQGYEPEAQVVAKGQIALRGGILDVFPLNSPWPVRLEFFGDQLDSLRYFDPFTQISKETVESITISPAGELTILKKLLGIGPPADLKRPSAALANSSLATLIDYLPSETIFLFSESEALSQAAEVYAEQVPAHDPFFVDWGDLRKQIATRGMTIVELEELLETEISRVPEPKRRKRASSSLRFEDVVGTGGTENRETAQQIPREKPTAASVAADSELGNLDFRGLDAFRPLGVRTPDPQVAETQRREFFGLLDRWLKQGYSVHVFCNNEGERQRFGEIWAEYGLGESDPIPTMHLGALTRGFISAPLKLVVLTDAEIFGRYKVPRPRRLKSPHAQTSRSLLDIDFTDLEEGDYVVHLHHGIGRYLGLTMMPVAAGEKPLEKSSTTNQGTQECLAIEYAPSDLQQPPPKLYVPVSEAYLVSKYVGAGKARPPLNTLGGGRWAKTKEQAGGAVQDLAREMLAIQAARESQVGTAFPPDAPWQREFEGAFLYEETPDQMRAILQTKADMELPKPMDRLICGDVGYGKTEVAIRAAFKAVMGGRQVAVLVPTTVLAQQHFNTFRERMADYPARIELLSRFRTAGQQKRVVQQLSAGAVDIVIGTHRLLQQDIVFKDLGLVVIDEEQRFGVLHKEKFKQLRQMVDVLTLSATPIPRTLYLALTGARDMSTIETPPQDRLPVETIVAQYDERVIRDAIQRELNRG